jgi:hypothetical protein
MNFLWDGWRVENGQGRLASSSGWALSEKRAQRAAERAAKAQAE